MRTEAPLLAPIFRSDGQARLLSAEAAVHRPVNPTILTPEEFGERSSFLDNVRSGPAVAVIGELPWR